MKRVCGYVYVCVFVIRSRKEGRGDEKRGEGRGKTEGGETPYIEIGIVLY